MSNNRKRGYDAIHVNEQANGNGELPSVNVATIATELEAHDRAPFKDVTNLIHPNPTLATSFTRSGSLLSDDLFDDICSEAIETFEAMGYLRSPPPIPEETLRIGNEQPDALSSSPLCLRLCITEIESHPSELVLQCTSYGQDKFLGTALSVILRDGWQYTKLNKGTVIHLIICVFDKSLPSIANPTLILETEYVVDNKQHLIIVEPDLLLTGTRVSQSFLCQRRAVLNERYPVSIGSPSSAALYGIAAHSLLEHIIRKENLWEMTEDAVINFIDTFVDDCIEDLYCLNDSAENLKQYLISIFPAMLQWTKQYILPLDDLAIAVRDSRPRYSVLDTEETIWSVLYGLKGKIDVTLVSHQSGNDASLELSKSSPFGLHTQKRNASLHPINEEVRVFTSSKGRVNMSPDQILPLEFKSGRAHISHHAQVILYTLLLSDRLNHNLSQSLLLYLKSDPSQNFKPQTDNPGSVRKTTNNNNQLLEMKFVSTLTNEVRSLLIQRNSLAYYLAIHPPSPTTPSTQTSCTLPPLLESAHDCSTCYERPLCSLMSYMEDRSLSAEQQQAFSPFINHLVPLHRQFFRFWDVQIELEWREMERSKQLLWTEEVSAREANGKCLNGLVVTGGEIHHSTKSGKVSFQRAYPNLQSPFDSLSTPIGEILLISSVMPSSDSDQLGHQKNSDNPLSKFSKPQYAVAIGSVVSCTTNEIVLSVSAIPLRLMNSIVPAVQSVQHADLKSSQRVKRSRIDISYDLDDSAIVEHELLWRLDKEEFFTSFRVQKENLLQMFISEGEVVEDDDWLFSDLDVLEGKTPSYSFADHCARLRSLIVESNLPRTGLFGADYGHHSTYQNSQFYFHEGAKLVLDALAIPYSIDFSVMNKPLLPLTTNESVGNEDAVGTNSDSSVGKSLNGEIGNLAEAFRSFTPDQRQAILNFLQCQDYCLLVGMPGTGKSTIISFLCLLLTLLGARVLLCSYTHAAVDNVLVKIKEWEKKGVLGGRDASGIRMIRMGRMENVKPENHDITLCRNSNISKSSYSNVNELQQRLEKAELVATTCLGLSNGLLPLRKVSFDYAIVEEASQLTLPVTLGALYHAQKFLFVGDHYQLSPLVKCRQLHTVANGLTTSLFSILIDRLVSVNSSVSSPVFSKLTTQFRMCEPVMIISNELTYNGQLTCSSDECRNRKLIIPNSQLLREAPNLSLPMTFENNWLWFTLEPDVRVAFLDTKNVEAYEARGSSFVQNGVHLNPTTVDCTTKSDQLINQTEAEIVLSLVKAMVKGGIESNEIGIGCLYRGQCQFVNHLIAANIPNSQVEVDTVDRFQGRDKQCIILSCVRANMKGEVGGLLNDWKRMNVAFTRAKCKLIIVGHSPTLMKSPCMEAVLKLMHKYNWYYALPQSALAISQNK